MKTDTREKIVEYIQAHKSVMAHKLIREFNLSSMAIHKQLKKLIHSIKLLKSATFLVISNASQLLFSQIRKGKRQQDA